MLSVAKRRKMMLNHNIRKAITRGIRKCHDAGYSKEGDIETFVLVEIERTIKLSNKDLTTVHRGVLEAMADGYIVSISQLAGEREEPYYEPCNEDWGMKEG